MLYDAGVNILFHTMFVDSIMDRDNITGIIIENKSGRQAIFGKVIIDASGDADVSFKAGVPFWQADVKKDKHLGNSLMYRVGGFGDADKVTIDVKKSETANSILSRSSALDLDVTNADNLTKCEIEARLGIFEHFKTLVSQIIITKMKTNRRKFIYTAIAGGLAASTLPLSSCVSETKPVDSQSDLKARYAKLDEILKQPVLKKELFTTPVIIESLDLLHYDGNYLCRVRSKDGAEGISIAHGTISALYPIFLRKLQPFFIDQDARELDLILEKVYFYDFNFRYNGISLGLPLATIEFAILDMLGKIANKTMGQLIGDIHNPEIPIYVATEFRELPLEEHFDRIKESVAKYDAKALKIKVGYMYSKTKDIHYPGVPGKSEKLIALVREHFGDSWALYADSNSYYDVEGAIKIGKILEENKYGYFEEPVMYDHFEEIKAVADALTLPIANGEQDQSFYNFRWLIANDGLDIVQPDNFYFGGFIRGMKVALMANAFGKTCVPHMSGLGYLYNIQFVSALPNAGLHHEFKGLESDVPFECPTSPLKVVDGKIKVPTGPGMGIIIDPDYIKKHEIVKR